MYANSSRLSLTCLDSEEVNLYFEYKLHIPHTAQSDLCHGHVTLATNGRDLFQDVLVYYIMNVK